MSRNQHIEKTMNIVGVDSIDAALKAARIPKVGDPYPGSQGLIVAGKPEAERVTDDLYKILVACRERPKQPDPVGPTPRQAAQAV